MPIFAPMPSYLQIENISKSYGPKVLFDRISFNINEGDKVALIAPNGTGKTSLLRILAGKDASDSGGKVLFLRHIRIAFLEQEYAFDADKTILEQVLSSCADAADEGFALRARQLLDRFGLTDPGKRMRELSGGEVKRVAIAAMLASEADFYIMDEPTNHLDLDAIEALENHLRHSRCTLLMVTHDRYFLDRVCNTVMELDRGEMFLYRGDYMHFLEKRQERIDNYNAQTERVRNLFRRELEWIHASPCARTGKAKYRKQAFERIKARAEDAYIRRQVDLGGVSGEGTYLGNKVINCRDLSFRWEGKCYLDRFTYNFQRYERVGVVGPNAVGKTTFLNLLAGELEGGTVEGVLDRGETLRIGYYRQRGMDFKPGQTVLETVADTRLLERFLFPHDMWNTRVERLSGGERRRLYLLTVLMQRPNFLILDEPTNDLDILTLQVLEEYLLEFKGSMLVVSHDRHFLDRLVDHLFVFCGEGVVKDFVGNYTEYRSFLQDLRSGKASEGEKGVAKASGASPDSAIAAPAGAAAPKKLKWKEQRELEALEAEIEALQQEKSALEAVLSGGSADVAEIVRASQRIGEVLSLLETKEDRWLELNL
ncbi:MAG: ABC-F family ATP-binding cassette domain-containing protein [Bacteroidales bacterium]|nr:ABC-F family ATP-binding cassette domain-containing protein [Bacteroidales bacterium]